MFSALSQSLAQTLGSFEVDFTGISEADAVRFTCCSSRYISIQQIPSHEFGITVKAIPVPAAACL